MISARHCSKPGCSRSAVATLTYDYRDSTVVLGPLATSAEPNAYDLCDEHAEHLTAPRGWQVVRLATSFEPAPPSGDDLMALVDAVRRAAHAPQEARPADRRPAASHSPGAADLGPFADPAPQPARATGEPETRSALDPQSPYAQRRARFHVISDPAAP
ncbi:DUF3499 domain-containing protein [Actinomyces sp. B33]|uniref:DUF3499 domain-containing protein n=1 Tax=Actinomyces sp. B33 TaxID=2942131 RepID=UPI002340601F|nr:DUF3499 domain-containing protein [Actinomyces sp. B33]MDC4232665.1 DUF3499 domain-containing protein [Actinomyces sp. B33]